SQQAAAVAAPPPAPISPAPAQGAPASSSAPVQAAVGQPGVAASEQRRIQVTLAEEHAFVRSSPAAFRHGVDAAAVVSSAATRRSAGTVPMPAVVTLGVGLAG